MYCDVSCLGPLLYKLSFVSSTGKEQISTEHLIYVVRCLIFLICV